MVYEETVFLDTPEDLDVIFIPPTDERVAKEQGAGMTFFENDRDAGDILPTFVTAEDAKRYMGETDTAYSQLDMAVMTSNVPDNFKVSWGLQLASWKTFFTSAMATVGFLNAKAVMEQTDRFKSELANWRTGFEAVGGKAPNPPPIAPGQGVPSTGNPANDIFKIAMVGGAIAALVIFGPKLASHL